MAYKEPNYGTKQDEGRENPPKVFSTIHQRHQFRTLTVEIMVLNRVPFTLSQEKIGVTCFVKVVKMLVLNRVPFTFSQDLELHAIGNTGKYAGDIGDVSSNSNEP